MTNRINGGPTGSDAIDAIDAVEKARAAEEVEGASGFDAVMAGQQVDAAGELSAADPVVLGVIEGVAADLKAGAIATPDAALEAVIDRLVEARFDHLEPELRHQMSADLRLALTDDPFFVLEVEELIGHALHR